jgi:FkbM family methyltransferase
MAIRVPLLDAWPCFEVFAFGEYDFPMIRWEVVRSVIDCGAHIGSFTLWASRKSSSQIVSVEPNPHASGLLKKNVAVLGPRVSIVNSAMAAAGGQRKMYDRGFPGLSSLLNRGASTEGFEVSAITLEDVINLGGPDGVDLLKMDVEGAEQEIFEATPVAALRRIKMAIVECHPHQGANWRMVSERLEEAGMSVVGEPRLVVAWRDSV